MINETLKIPLLVTVLVILLCISFHSSYALEDTEIPQWVKNTAKWWHDGKATDKQFLIAISWLAKTGTISMPTESDNNYIPHWMKNMTNFYSSNLIGDNEFRNALSYLLQNNVIQIRQQTLNIIDARGLNEIEYSGYSPLFRTYAYASDFISDNGKPVPREIHFELKPELNSTYDQIAMWDKPHRSAVIVPLFTSTAYWEPGFYTYYRGDCDSNCLTKKIQFDRPLGFSASGNAVAVLKTLGYDTVTDLDVDQNPDILKQYDKVIVLHNEYVTQREFDAITHHPKVIYLYANPLYAKVTVNYQNDTITLVKGHGYPTKDIRNAFGWQFDNSQKEYDTDCSGNIFYKVSNGIMQDCYPENIIYTNMTLLKMIKDY